MAQKSLCCDLLWLSLHNLCTDYDISFYMYLYFTNRFPDDFSVYIKRNLLLNDI